MAHTPTPWFYRDEPSDYGADDVTHGTIEGKDFILAVMVNDTIDGRANAAFIVRAVNAHDDLVAALQSAREYFDNISDADHDGVGFVPNAEMRLVSEIDEALAKAGAA